MTSDGLWAAMGPMAHRVERDKGGPTPVLPDRSFLEALRYLARTGVPLSDLHAEFGK